MLLASTTWEGGMRQLPVKFLKTDEVANSFIYLCILLFGARISAVGKCSNQVQKE